jgi:hyperosmotically inducible protein
MNTPESSRAGRSFGRLVVIVLLLVVVIVGAGYYLYSRSPSLQNALRSFKESSQDTATTSKVRAALLLSKHVSPFDIKVETSGGKVTLIGQVPSEEIKAVAGAIAQDTSGAQQVRNELTINPATQRNPETERLSGRIADLEIKTIVSDAILQNAELRDQHIETQVNKCVVALNGTVETANQKHAAEQIAWQAAGVQGVTNNLAVTSPGATPESADEKLARQVEFELYSTKAISLKTVQIHAESGTVTLTGSVATRAEKLLAEKVAQEVEGVRKVVNNLAAPPGIEP